MTIEEIKARYPEGTDMNQFNTTESISRYNFNYHIGFENDLLFAKSDDDDTTCWYLIQGKEKPIFIGHSLCSQDDILSHIYPT